MKVPPLMRRKRLWWVVLIATAVIGFVIFQLPPGEWQKVKIGVPLPAEIAAWRYQEPAKSEWFGPKFWGFWIMALQFKNGSVSEKQVILRIGTGRRFVRIALFSSGEEDPPN